MIYSDKTKKILSLFKTKGSKDVNAFDCMSKNIVSLQIKANEVYIKPLKPREALLSIQESDEEEDDEDKSVYISDIDD